MLTREIKQQSKHFFSFLFISANNDVTLMN
jgi:hypothetical protein